MVHELDGSAANGKTRLWNETRWIPDLAQEMQLQTQITNTEHKHRTQTQNNQIIPQERPLVSMGMRKY